VRPYKHGRVPLLNTTLLAAMISVLPQSVLPSENHGSVLLFDEVSTSKVLIHGTNDVVNSWGHLTTP
jgi:hypothetical protein